MDLIQEPYTTEQKIKIESLEAKIKVLEAQVAMLKEQELNILNALPALVFVCDYNEQLVFLNRLAQEFLGYKGEEIYNLLLRDLLPPDSLHFLRRKYFNLFKTNQPAFINELKVITASREEKYLSIAIAKYYSNFEQVGFVGLGYLPAEFIDSKLAESNKSLLKFISLIAHDLRNPFNSLIGFSNLLLENYDGYTDEKRKEYIRHLYTASSQGFQLLDNLLEWSRITTGSIKPSPVIFNLNLVIENTLRLLESTVIKKEISTHISLQSDLSVYADPNMIQAAIRNIISNAIKFTHRQGRIEVLTYKTKQQVVVEIKDNGVGMTNEVVKNLFKIGMTVSSKGTEGEKGTGMGLLLSKEFIELNNGKISVQSTPGKGSTFKIKLPLA
ncbi:MAG: ATP-binding protein [Bacteroidales bacterium]|nr:ATP-binding protein [Bacteroidales bacterium]